jgi:hypothetical protein
VNRIASYRRSQDGRTGSAGLASGAVFSTVIGFFLQRKTAEIKNDIEQRLQMFKSKRDWQEAAHSDLLGPVYMQLDRTKRAFDRWKGKNLYLETKIIKEANETIRNLLLTRSHLIPPELRPHAGRLIKHYDRWLEEFERLRLAEKPDLDTPFTFVVKPASPFWQTPRKNSRRNLKSLEGHYM